MDSFVSQLLAISKLVILSEVEGSLVS